MSELLIKGYGDDLSINGTRIGDLTPREHEEIEKQKGGQNYAPLEDVVISKVKDRFSIPIIGYCVSGVYSMIKSASKENLIQEIDVTMEILFSIKRAGATAIITYSAVEIARKLNKE